MITCRLALRRLRHNRSTTILTLVAMVLTSGLLMTLGTGMYGMVQDTRAKLSNEFGNHHAQLPQATREQIETLSRHMEIEALYAREDVARLTQDRINAALLCEETLLEGIRVPGITQGRSPQAENEIAMPPLFLERLGVAPQVGERVTLHFRFHGEGEILTEEFVVTGLVEQQDADMAGLPDNRISYSAYVSKAFADKHLAGTDREYFVYLRVTGEEALSYNGMEEKLRQVARDVGYPEERLNLNFVYLYWMVGLDPGLLAGSLAAAALIVGFCALVLYSINYVSVITNIQELGKIRALGSSKGQMKALLLWEGLLSALISLPFGLLLGYLAGRYLTDFIYDQLSGSLSQRVSSGSGFSPGITLLVVAFVLVTVVLSLLRPMSVVAKISPMEAIRYQENSAAKAGRKGFATVNLTRLSRANLQRNPRRTAVTILTLGAGCVLFMTVAGVLSGMNALNYARRALPKGDFYLSMNFSVSDETYPENNLDSMQKNGLLDRAAAEKIGALPGVEQVEPRHMVMADVHDAASGDSRRISIGAINREDFAHQKVYFREGAWDYDLMLAENGVVYTSYVFLDRYGLAIGQELPMTLYAGTGLVDTSTKLVAAIATADADYLMPEERFRELAGDANTVAGIYVWTSGESYSAVKARLQEMAEQTPGLQLLCLDEEIAVAQFANKITIVIAYGFLAVLGIVSLLNLINTMITSVVTRRRELGLLQAVGLSNRQMSAMLRREGMLFTAGALAAGLTLGNLLGYLAFLWARNAGFSGLLYYQYPWKETIVMVVALAGAQALISCLTGRYVRRDSIISRIQL